MYSDWSSLTQQLQVYKSLQAVSLSVTKILRHALKCSEKVTACNVHNSFHNLHCILTVKAWSSLAQSVLATVHNVYPVHTTLYILYTLQTVNTVHFVHILHTTH